VLTKNARFWLHSNRTVRFGDIDGAGVIHFHHLFKWCHEAWEESIESYGLKTPDIFPGRRNTISYPKIALPIIHCEADFKHPIHTGEELTIQIEPKRINSKIFEVKTTFLCQEIVVASGLLRHMAIIAATRESCDLPEGIDSWLESSS